MHPVLFQIVSFKLHTYGAFMGMGFLLAMHLVSRRGRDLDISDHLINQCILIAIVGGILGARFLYVIVDNPLSYLSNPLSIFKIWQGGLVYFGGFVLAISGIIWYTHRSGENVLKVLDLLVPALVLAHAVGRLGCFMAGCCYGKICHLPWAVEFTHPLGVGLKHAPLHPTQIYSGVFLVLLYFVLLLSRRWQRFYGTIIATYLIIYPIGRSIIETLRGDYRGGFLNLSTAQWMSIPMIAIGIGIFVYGRRQQIAQKAKTLTT